MRLRLRKRWVVFGGLLALPTLALGALLLFLALDRLAPFPCAALERPAAGVITDRHGAALRYVLPPDDTWRFPVARDELPDELVRAVVAAEDRRFYHHPGVDPVAILRAAWSNLRAGEVVSGASTIPMQIARMADPSPRTLAAKLRESFRALQLGLHRSKEELLDTYLDLAPYGSNIEGVGAAARFYFGKEPGQLSLGEIALLVVLPRSPVAFDPTLHPEAARRARGELLDRLERQGVFSAEEIAAARREPIPTRRRPTPWQAPHFTDLVLQASAPAEGVSGTERTTLDLGLQRTVERLVRGRIGALRAEGLGNAAVVVEEIDNRAVRALVGSAGYSETRYEGQVNGAVARRSPGSTLKPFLYAMALDRGLVVPDSYLLDVPTDFAGYVPKNYDGRYRGRVTAREALVHSLNAPAVRLLARVGLAPFYRLLVRGGLETLDRPAAEYGLPLILGAGEVTLLDLTNLYATLAAGGVHHPVRLLAAPDSPPGEAGELGGARFLDAAARYGLLAPGEDEADRLVSPEAAWTVTEMLGRVQRPDLPRAWDLTRGAPEVAWKTGTSYGHRDAWAVGFSRHFAVGVWVGSFDGSPTQGISGSEHAAPLLFEVFRAIEPGGVAPVKPVGLHLGTIELCTLSHQLPGPFCPEVRRYPYLPGHSRLETCAIHRRVPIDRETGGLVTADCGPRPFSWRRVLVYPAELVAWQRATNRLDGGLDPQSGEEASGLPAVSPRCPGGQAGEPPRIVSPDAATPYRLRRDAPLAYQRIALVARTGLDARRLYWYQDGLLVGTAAVGEPLFLTPARGHHRLAVTDDQGRTDGMTYEVE